LECANAGQRCMRSGLVVDKGEGSMEEKHIIPCTFMAREVCEFTRPSYGYLVQRTWNDSIKAPLIPIIKRIPYTVSLWRQIQLMISPADDGTRDTNQLKMAQRGVMSVDEVLDLQPGELVQVRSLDEIYSTLDGEGKYKGLLFMPEMEDFCEKKYHVFKKVRSITLETDGEVRKLKSPTVFLEGVYCDGKRHNNCDRSCLLFWREAWLKRVEP